VEKNRKFLVLMGGGMPQAYWYEAGDVPIGDLVPGAVVEAPLRNRIVPGIVVEIGEPVLAFATKSIRRLAPESARVPLEWLELLKWMAKYYLTTLPIVLQSALPKTATRFLFHPPKRLPRASKAEPARKSDPGMRRMVPTAEQTAAIAAVSEVFSPFVFRTFLLHGITGSGKTLVYLQLAEKVLAAGRRVLVLLPEIALTPQTIGRFEAYLGRKIPAFHSGLSEPARRDLWKKIFAGEADIVVGARSAVLAPLDNLGLIVVDEEHDSSYKQNDPAPRYHARDLALFRGKQAGCPVVLGSATPSMETYHAALSGKHVLLELRLRATAAALPDIHVVDMKEQLAIQGPDPLSIPLRDAVQQAMDKGEQAILFLNRRGYSPRRVCAGCGETRMCPHCAVALVYHRSTEELLCHYCGFAAPALSACPKCQSNDFVDSGRGIEKIEEHLARIFPGIATARLDRDSTARQGESERILDRFRDGEIRILLGTQMVAKGHDFPKVNVVGVLDAEGGLSLADFRAEERVFQLITQVAGRAGRHGGAGRVFLQTFKPESALLRFALQHDYRGFFQAESGKRRELGYPPFRKLLLFEMLGPDEDQVRKEMDRVAVLLHEFAPAAHAEVLGPAYAALKKIRKDYRLQALVKGPYPNQLQWLAEKILEHYQPPKKNRTRLRLDRDPVSLA